MAEKFVVKAFLPMLRWRIKARYFEWRLARTLRPANVESSHEAEEALWVFYFQHSAQRHPGIRVRRARLITAEESAPGQIDFKESDSERLDR